MSWPVPRFAGQGAGARSVPPRRLQFRLDGTRRCPGAREPGEARSIRRGQRVEAAPAWLGEPARRQARQRQQVNRRVLRRMRRVRHRSQSHYQPAAIRHPRRFPLRFQLPKRHLPRLPSGGCNQVEPGARGAELRRQRRRNPARRRGRFPHTRGVCQCASVRRPRQRQRRSRCRGDRGVRRFRSRPRSAHVNPQRSAGVGQVGDAIALRRPARLALPRLSSGQGPGRPAPCPYYPQPAAVYIRIAVRGALRVDDLGAVGADPRLDDLAPFQQVGRLERTELPPPRGGPSQPEGGPKPSSVNSRYAG